MGRSKAPSLPIKALSFCRPTELRGWQRNWIHRGAPRPANPVTCFPPGKVVAPATKGGLHFRRPQGGCMVLIYDGAEGAVPRQRSGTSYLPRAEPSTRPGGVSRSRTEPLAPRAVRPGGAINPRGEAASTFGNTGKHRPGPDPDRAASAPISSVPQRSHGADRYTLQ